MVEITVRAELSCDGDKCKECLRCPPECLPSHFIVGGPDGSGAWTSVMVFPTLGWINTNTKHYCPSCSAKRAVEMDFWL